MSNNRINTAIETLEKGGFFYGYDSSDFYGKRIVKISLYNENRKVIKGIGQSTLSELVRRGMIIHYNADYGPKMIKLRGFIHGEYRLLYGPPRPAW